MLHVYIYMILYIHICIYKLYVHTIYATNLRLHLYICLHHFEAAKKSMLEFVEAQSVCWFQRFAEIWMCTKYNLQLDSLSFDCMGYIIIESRDHVFAFTHQPLRCLSFLHDNRMVRCLKGHLWHPGSQLNWRSSSLSEVHRIQRKP